MDGFSARSPSLFRIVLPHGIAIALSMIFALRIWQSPYMQTGLQFVAPALIIVLCHLAWQLPQIRRRRAWGGQVMKRAMASAVALFGLVLAAELLTPRSAHAGGFESVLMMLFCLLIVVLAVWAVISVATVIYAWLRLASRAIGRLLGRSDGDGGQTGDFAGMVVVLGLLVLGSFEGLPWAFAFEGRGESRADRLVSAPPQRVWQVMETATSPRFPLPAVLKPFPQPVAVLTDEGVGLHANRVVRFSGREGTGELHLRVVARSDEQATFRVLSDSSPMAAWIRFESLTYRVTPEGRGSRISVQLHYERLLAPAWIMAPLMRATVYLAMDVLARDTKSRAERTEV